MKPQTLVKIIKCLDCPRLFEQHRHNHVRCVMCSHAFQTAKATERARAKRLAAKEKKS